MSEDMKVVADIPQLDPATELFVSVGNDILPSRAAWAAYRAGDCLVVGDAKWCVVRSGTYNTALAVRV